MSKSTKLTLVASAILSLSVFAACVPQAVEIPPSVGPTATATPNTTVTATPDATITATPNTTVTATPTANTPVTSTPTPNTPVTTTPTTAVSTPTATATVTGTPSPTGTPTTLSNGSSSGGSSSGGGGSQVSPPIVTSISRTPDTSIVGIMGDTITVTGSNLASGSGTIQFYLGPTYQAAPSRSVSIPVSLTASSNGTSATATIPTLTDDQVNTILGRAAGTAVTTADRTGIIANVFVLSSSGGTAQSGAIGAGGL